MPYWRRKGCFRKRLWPRRGSTGQLHTITVIRAAPSSSGGGGSVKYYTIKETAETGGSISPSGSTSVISGSDKTYNITPDEGCEIEDVLVDGESVGAISTYTFENVKKAHTITASFKETETETDNPFTDVSDDDWFYDYVAILQRFIENMVG